MEKYYCQMCSKEITEGYGTNPAISAMCFSCYRKAEDEFIKNLPPMTKLNKEEEIRKEFIELCMQDHRTGIHYFSTQSEGFKEDMGVIADFFLNKMQEERKRFCEKIEKLPTYDIEKWEGIGFRHYTGIQKSDILSIINEK